MKQVWQTRRQVTPDRVVELEQIKRGFQPNRLIRAGKVQTIASSYALGRRLSMLAGEQVVVVDGGQDVTGYDANVRLFGYYNRHLGEGASRGLVVTLHGWEGCSHSLHNMILGARLLDAGYDLFRLNLRDHGPHHHVNPYALNRGLFMGTLIEEAHCAVQRVAAWAEDLPVYVVGPSLGGNFVLRMAMRHASQPICNLTRVVAISPVINPARTSHQIDAQLEFRHYFRSRWLKSVLAKQQLFPELYHFDPIVKMPRVRDMTDWLVRRYSDFADADDYFEHYALRGDALVGLSVPTTILTAVDDPVIDVADFADLTPTPLLDIRIQRYGGHVGFIDVWPLRHLLPEMVLAELGRV